MKRILFARVLAAVTVVAAASGLFRGGVAGGQTATPGAATAPATAESPSGSLATSGPQDAGPQDAERLKIWNSPEMSQARQYVLDYSQRSVQFTPQDADAYLAKLSQMSPSEMKAWLERFNSKQANRARSEAVAKAGRQLAVGEALGWQQSVQQSYANLKAGQAEAAFLNDQRYKQQQQTGWSMAGARDAFRVAQAEHMLTHDYSWVAFPSYYTRAAAAASLPGDLPAGDPRNFIRGDVPGPEVVAAQAAAAQSAASPAAAGGAGAAAGAGGGAAAGGGGAP